MIKSTKTTLLFSNSGKLDELYSFINEYKNVVSQFIDIFWDMTLIPKTPNKEITDKIETWLSARAIQCAGKQASGIVRGTRRKQEKRKKMIEILVNKKQYKKARKLQRIYDEVTISKPNIQAVEPELDSRFVKIDLQNKTLFDGWLTLTSLGNQLKIQIPFKKHKHFNKLLEKGKLKAGVRLSKKNITFMFDIPDPIQVETGSTLGIDIGQKSTLSCSNGQLIDIDKHNHNYQSICQKLSRKTKGSKGFQKVVQHRTNYINWCVKQLNINNVKQVNRENIKYMRKGKRTSRSLQHWNYKELFDKLDSKLTDSGVQINKLNPTYTSQRCSSCGWVRKGNRKEKRFKCDKCNLELDSDLNASINLSLPLITLSKEQRQLKSNRTGFYWNLIGQEPIVPVTQKTN